MKYYFSKTLNVSFDEAIPKVIEELKKGGFGIITEIDMKETLKKKLNVDFRKYRILGACNPQYAYQALLVPCFLVMLSFRKFLKAKWK